MSPIELFLKAKIVLLVYSFHQLVVCSSIALKVSVLLSPYSLASPEMLLAYRREFGVMNILER